MVEQILRERVYVDQNCSVKEIMQKYGLCQATAYRAKKVGYFCKNYSVPQVKIEPENYNPELVLNMARKLFWKKFGDDPVAKRIMADLIQEGCLNAWIKSGYYKPSKKYNLNYQIIVAISNGMTAFYTSYLKNLRYKKTARTGFKIAPK